MVHVGNAVCHPNHIALLGCGNPVGMAQNAVPHLFRQIESGTAFFQPFHNTQTLFVMPIAVGTDAVQDCLAAVPERRVPQIVSQCDCFCQVLIEAKRTGNGSGDLCYLQRVCQPCAVMIAYGGEKDLRLSFYPPKGVAM